MLGFNTLDRLDLTFNALAITARPTLFTTFKVTTIVCLTHSELLASNIGKSSSPHLLPSLHGASKQLKTGPYKIAGKHLATFFLNELN